MTMHKRQIPTIALFLLSPALLANDELAELPVDQRLTAILLVAVLGIAFCFGVVALALVYCLLRPPAVRHNDLMLREHPVRSLFAGAIGIAIMVLFWALTEAVPVIGLISLAVTLAVLYLSVAGLAGFCHCLGDKLLSNINSRFGGSSFAAVLGSGILLSLLILLPVVGWILQGLFTVIGFGAAVSVLFRRRPKAAATPPVPPADKTE